MIKTALKLIFRNWWRNKTFTLISILSLTVGIACTALLISFVSYEYGIENSNPNRDKMVWVMQDLPSDPGNKVAYMHRGIPEQLMDKYTEVEDFLQLNSFDIKHIEVNNQYFNPIDIINVNTSFTKFFPFELLYGSWHTINDPQSIIISDKQAYRFFGNNNALGKQISVFQDDWGVEIMNTYTVGGVAKTRSQSAITFDGLICNPETNWGGPTLLMMPKNSNLNKFEEKVKRDEIPTLSGGQYCLASFDKSISSSYNQQELSYWHYRKNSLLLVGLISAILIFLIAIFNYVNMSFSRILQQVKTLHTQKLMGAHPIEVRIQIFADTFLTVFISFVLAILLMHDLLPVFNQIVSVDFSSEYFYSKDFIPLLILLVIILTVIPSQIMSRKVSRLSGSDYRIFFATHKNRWIGLLVTIQFIIAFAIIIATITARHQVSFTKQSGNRYLNLIEISTSAIEIQELHKYKSKVEVMPGVDNVSIGDMPVLNTIIMHSTIKKENGEKIETMTLKLSGDEELFNILDIHQLSGKNWTEVYTNQNSVLVNKTFADALGKSETELVNEPLSKYLIEDNSISIITGVVDDFCINSLEDKAKLVVIQPYSHQEGFTITLRIKLDGKNNPKTISSIKSEWQRVFPETHFTYIDTYDTFIKNNNKIFEMSRLLQMYSLISILLTCFGLFGITFYAVKQRTKEIGIRKINGARTINILWLLMKPMLVWMTVGFAIAAPLAWLFVEKWLQQFVYRVDISFTPFIIAILIVVITTILTVGWHVWRTARANPSESLKSE